MTWHWPQYVVLATVLLSVLTEFGKYYRDRRLSSWAVVVAVAITVAIEVGFAWVLHEGGFW